MHTQPGLVAAVTCCGERILTIGEGVADKTSKSPCTPDVDTIFHVASMTKEFVVSDGHMNLCHINC